MLVPDRARIGVSHDWTGGEGVGNARPRKRIVRIQCRCPPIRLHRALRRRRRELVPEITALQIQVLGLGILRLPAGQGVETVWRQAQPDFLRNRSAQLLLHREHADWFAIVGVRPHLHLVLHTNEVGGDVQPLVLGSNRTDDQVRD